MAISSKITCQLFLGINDSTNLVIYIYIYIYINRPTVNNCYITQIFKAIFIIVDSERHKKHYFRALCVAENVEYKE